MMAVESPLVTADVIEAIEFPHLSQKYRVMGVPKSIVNEVVEMDGAYPEAQFLAAVLKAVTRP